jgi:hypothetical protein
VAFQEGKWDPAPSYYLLQTKGNAVITLEEILKYLSSKMAKHAPISVGWTCCRSPLGNKSEGKIEARGAVRYEDRTEGSKVTDALEIGKPEIINGQCDGYITFVSAESGTANLITTWEGVPETLNQHQISADQTTIGYEIKLLKGDDKMPESRGVTEDVTSGLVVVGRAFGGFNFRVFDSQGVRHQDKTARELKATKSKEMEALEKILPVKVWQDPSGKLTEEQKHKIFAALPSIIGALPARTLPEGARTADKEYASTTKNFTEGKLSGAQDEPTKGTVMTGGVQW